MTVDQLLAKLAAAFPAFNAKALEALASVYRARLEKHEGVALAQAYIHVIGGFTVKGSKALFPMPADFEAQLPSMRLDLGQNDVQKLDLDGRKRRADNLFANWRMGQGERAGKGIPTLIKAMENMARPLADVLGWQENPEPLILTRDQLKIACQRAISFERLQRHGQPPKDVHQWWGQVQSIAGEWRIQITPEWWDKETAKAINGEPDEKPRLVATSKATELASIVPKAPKDPAAHRALLEARIRFFSDMGMVDYVDQMKRELAELEREAA